MKWVVSIGCPAGIGPEVAVVAAAKSKGRAVLVGDLETLRAAATLRGVDPQRLYPVQSARDAAPRGSIPVWSPGPPLAKKDRTPGKPTKAGGKAQLLWVDAATDAVLRGDADAMVTGPVNKHIIVESGVRDFRGHTEHIQARAGAKEVVMAFATDALTTALVTTHLPLRSVPKAITAARVATATYWLADLCIRRFRGKGRPKVAVCGLNPHAGERGLLGDEERIIEAGMVLARKRLGRRAVDLLGPLPSESVFRQARDGAYQGVVAMYHDQATIPMKLLAFGDAVNVSLGLPLIRTSVDHGTAYDRAGTGTADAAGMEAAFRLAAELASEGA
jgi:4-hydroxythreonine-4-phosphate dehydrogenase